MTYRRTLGVLGLLVALGLIALAVWKWDPTRLQLAVLVVLGVGGLGGLVNGIIAAEGLQLPRMTTINDADGKTTKRILQLGFVGNAFIGAVAALLEAATGNLKSMPVVFGIGDTSKFDATKLEVFSLGAVAQSFIIGLAGAAFLKAVIDKGLWKTAAILNAQKPADPAALAAAAGGNALLAAQAAAGNTTTNGNAPAP